MVPTKDQGESTHHKTGLFDSSEQALMLKEVFQLFDTDGKGQLGEKELASAIFAMGFSTQQHHKMAKTLLSQFSENGNLSLAQFTELIRGQVAGRDPEEQIKSTFTSLCGDNPNVTTINFERLKLKVRKLQIRLSDEELREMLSDADRNGDGELDLDEYILILKNSTWI